MRDGSRGAAPAEPQTGGSPWTASAEVEELPARPVGPRGAPRLGVAGTLGVVAIIALLAAGFGVLGGRPDASFGPSAAVVAPPGRATPSQTGGHPASPRVTPWIECAAPATALPDVVLQVDGRPFDSTVEILAPVAGPPTLPSSGPTGPIDVPVDVITEIWVSGGTCALGWRIALADHAVLDHVPNEARDPAYASQNRFQVLLSPGDTGEFTLEAELVLAELVARATWPIRIIPLQDRLPTLRTERSEVRAVEGCDVTITFGALRAYSPQSCEDDVGEPPGDALPVVAGERLVFALDGWHLDAASVMCGRLAGPSFMGQLQPGCYHEMDGTSEIFEFAAPSHDRRWTLALSACGSSPATRGAGRNRVCGTWYADIVLVADR